MQKQETLLLIKPNAVRKKVIGRIITMLEEAGFHFKKMKFFKMNLDLASEFYAVHKEKPFYSKLLEFMTSGNTVAIILEKINAIDDLRRIVGNTNPLKAEKGTIRNLYGDDLTQNAVHASDSIEHSQGEIDIIFKK